MRITHRLLLCVQVFPLVHSSIVSRLFRFGDTVRWKLGFVILARRGIVTWGEEEEQALNGRSSEIDLPAVMVMGRSEG